MNKFSIRGDGTREEVIAQYQRWLCDEGPALMAALPELRGEGDGVAWELVWKKTRGDGSLRKWIGRPPVKKEDHIVRRIAVTRITEQARLSRESYQACGRPGRYSVERLVAAHGDAKLIQWLARLADCPRRARSARRQRRGLGLMTSLALAS